MEKLGLNEIKTYLETFMFPMVTSVKSASLIPRR